MGLSTECAGCEGEVVSVGPQGGARIDSIAIHESANSVKGRMSAVVRMTRRPALPRRALNVSWEGSVCWKSLVCRQGGGHAELRVMQPGAGVVDGERPLVQRVDRDPGVVDPVGLAGQHSGAIHADVEYFEVDLDRFGVIPGQLGGCEGADLDAIDDAVAAEEVADNRGREGRQHELCRQQHGTDYAESDENSDFLGGGAPKDAATPVV